MPTQASAPNLATALPDPNSLPTSRRAAWMLVLAGANLMLLNFLLVQHAVVAIRHAEIAVLGCSLAYFVGVSFGYRFSDRCSDRFLHIALPVCLAVQMALFLLAPGLVQVLGSAAGTGVAGAALFAVTALFATSVHAVFLPRLLPAGGGLRRGYSFEVAGSLVGLALMPLLAGLGHGWVLAAYFASYAALTWLAGAGQAVTGGIVAGAAVYVAAFGTWDRQASAWFLSRLNRWNNPAIEFSRFTPYHKVEVVRTPDGDRRLLLNGQRQFGGDPRRTYSFFVAEVPARLLGRPKVAVLGCGSMATVGRIGKMVPDIRIVDLDPVVFEAARRFFAADNRLDELDNWTFEADDAKHWIANSREQFGLILHDIPPARSRQVALTYTEEFFRLVKARLEPGGLFSISSLTPVEGASRYSRRMLATLDAVFDRYVVVLNRGSAFFYGGGPGFQEPTAAEIQSLVKAAGRPEVRILNRAEVRELVRGEPIITAANVGDLIYE